MRYISNAAEIGCRSESNKFARVIRALMIRDRSTASKANQPKGEPVAAAIIGTIPVSANSEIAINDPNKPPNPFHKDLAYPFLNSPHDEYM